MDTSRSRLAFPHDDARPVSATRLSLDVATPRRTQSKGTTMKLRTALAAVVAIAGLGLVEAAPAGADPTNGVTDEWVCDTLGTVSIVSFSNAAQSPGLVVGSNQVVTPYELYLHVTFTPTVGDPVSRVVAFFSRPAPRNGRLDHCTLNVVRTFPTGTAVFDGYVLLSYTPG